MGKKLPYTPRSRVRSALRRLWLTSRERAAAVKRESYTCQRCGIKQSKAKGKEVSIEVHHIQGVAWEEMIDKIYEEILIHPQGLEVLCIDCHKKDTPS